MTEPHRDAGPDLSEPFNKSWQLPTSVFQVSKKKTKQTKTQFGQAIWLYS